jgi:rubrerythrin
MAAYSAAHAIAQQLGNRDVADLLQQTLDEEREADETLARIAAQMLEMNPDGDEGEDAGQGRKTNRRSGMRSSQPVSRRAGR